MMFKSLTNMFAKDELQVVKTVKKASNTRGRKAISKRDRKSPYS